VTAVPPLLETLQAFKQRPDTVARIPIKDAAGETVAWFAPVRATVEHARLITDWRNAHREKFMTSFEATTERTLAWIQSGLIEREDRILFMVETHKGTPVGHLGLTAIDLETGACELDYGCRGRRDLLPGVFALAYGGLTAWALDTLGSAFVIGRVFEDNPKPIELLQLHGFEFEKRVAMRRIEDDDGVRWVEADTEDPEAGERVLVQYVRHRS